MKRNSLTSRVAAFVMLLALAAFISPLFNNQASAQKQGRQGNAVTSSDLDHAYVQGATVKYVLGDEEIVGQDGQPTTPLYYSNGTVVRRCDARIIVDYTAIDNRRDAQGRKLFRLKINRPDFYGGTFERDAPADPGRSFGTFDSLQPGDLVN